MQGGDIPTDIAVQIEFKKSEHTCSNNKEITHNLNEYGRINDRHVRARTMNTQGRKEKEYRRQKHKNHRSTTG